MSFQAYTVDFRFAMNCRHIAASHEWYLPIYFGSEGLFGRVFRAFHSN